MPGDTRAFAHALGFGQRSALENNRAGNNHKLAGATTDSTDNPWVECQMRIGSEPRWVIWHHWPDNRLHDLGDQAGKGLPDLAKEAAQRLTEPDFWSFVERLTTGRSLLITSDHGYAATGLFPDVADQNQSNHLKQMFASKRYASPSQNTNGPSWIPPTDLVLSTPHGKTQLVLGRRKWKSPGGYPSLTHGGLSVLEVCSPFIEITKA